MEGRRVKIDPVWITDAATVTSLGEDLNEVWNGLLKGETGIRPVQRFSVQNYTSNLAACIEDLRQKGGRSMLHDLLERLFSSLDRVPQDCFVITATAKSGIDNLERLRRGLPVDTQDILPSSMPRIIARRLGLKSDGINISAACASSTVAIGQGAAMIASGRVNSVLICCFDLVTEYIFSGFSSLLAMSPEPCRPFDRDRKGLTLGEGAAALLLMSPDKARESGRSNLGKVLGWAVSNDAFHITAPAKDGSGLTEAAKQALKRSGLLNREITAICAHGTGTQHNDYMELNAFHEVMGDTQVPIFSVKGAIGHTVGAAGGIEVALCLESLKHQMVPPTIGLINPEKGAEGFLSNKPVRINGNYILKTSSGFGGVNAALILGRQKVS